MNEIEFLQSFRRNGDGTWSVTRPITIGSASMGPGATLGAGAFVGGLNIVETLNGLAAKHPHLVQT